MIEAYFHTMLLLQQALAGDYEGPDADGNMKVFVPRKDKLGPTEDQDDPKQFVLSPGPVDLGEGTALVLPVALQSGARSIGIGVVDVDGSQAEVYGSLPVQVTVTLVLGYEDERTWFRGKAISELIAIIQRAAYPNDLSGALTEDELQTACDIKPMEEANEEHYGLTAGSLQTASLRFIRELRAESFIAAATEDDVYVFWRSFIMELSV